MGFLDLRNVRAMPWWSKETGVTRDRPRLAHLGRREATVREADSLRHIK
jgi:hypothetical protein